LPQSDHVMCTKERAWEVCAGEWIGHTVHMAESSRTERVDLVLWWNQG